jgi:SAM-dependent methyltransferase
VQWEYASEERLGVRNETYKDLAEGISAEDVIFDAVREANPQRVLEVGCGTGEFGVRMREEIGAEVWAVDISPRMVELSRAHGLDAQLADVQKLPFEDGEFDCVVAAWVLYHVPDLHRGLSEIARVLKDGGLVVAATMGEGNLAELWKAVGDRATRGLTFGADNGAATLERWFTDVERRDARGTVVFPDREAMRRFVAATITRAHLADQVPNIDEPFRARTSHVVFTARKAS